MAGIVCTAHCLPLFPYVFISIHLHTITLQAFPLVTHFGRKDLAVVPYDCHSLLVSQENTKYSAQNEHKILC